MNPEEERVARLEEELAELRQMAAAIQERVESELADVTAERDEYRRALRGIAAAAAVGVD